MLLRKLKNEMYYAHEILFKLYFKLYMFDIILIMMYYCICV